MLSSTVSIRYHSGLFHNSETCYHNKLCDFHCSDSADKVVQGQGKFEEIVVASNEITASTVQLVSGTRQKCLTLDLRQGNVYSSVFLRRGFNWSCLSQTAKTSLASVLFTGSI